jgi:acyl-CoA synthetase (NDP forming)
MLFVSFPISFAAVAKNFNKGMTDSPKPKVMVALGDTWQLDPETLKTIGETPAVFSRSSDRMLRAINLYTRYGRSLARTRAAPNPAPFLGLPTLGKGPHPEWLGKKVLSAAGIRVPEGELARTPGEAAAIASRVGYPVALKAQAAVLSHKTEAGGVMLNLADEAALRAAWATMQQNVQRAAPTVTLDGCLVERMSPKGLELMIGAKRDPAWGTVLLLGLGGIWVEALGDVQLLPVDADETQCIEALHKLRTAKLLTGFRGAPPVDVGAIVAAVLALGRLMQTTPGIVEIDVNPLMVHPKGQGASALDALIVGE